MSSVYTLLPQLKPITPYDSAEPLKQKRWPIFRAMANVLVRSPLQDTAISKRRSHSNTVGSSQCVLSAIFVCVCVCVPFALVSVTTRYVEDARP